MTSPGSRTDTFPDVKGKLPFRQVLAEAAVQVARLLAALAYSNSGTGVFSGSPPRNLIASSTAPLSISMRQSTDIALMSHNRVDARAFSGFPQAPGQQGIGLDEATP